MTRHHPGHTIHGMQTHCGWNHEFPPVLRITPGETVTFETQEASGGQLTAKATLEDLERLDFARTNPVTGPVYIDGAEPGDAIRVTLLGFEPAGWGWTANIPGFGLLADQFPAPALHIWRYDARALTPALFGHAGRVPLKPFCGTIGLAPAEPGLHSVIPPRRVGGNLDIRDLSVGSELVLPVEAQGGLFSLGDTHAAQGDGEVCGTAIESPMMVGARFDLLKQESLPCPRFTTPGPVTRHLDAKGYDATTGIAPDLMAAARGATSGMIDLLSRRHGITPVEAYMLCSVAGDLRISEIVDRPNWVVSMYFPRVVFD